MKTIILLLIPFAVLFFGCTLSPVTGPETPSGPAPQTYFMDQNYPNPFIDTTQIRFGVPSTSTVTLVVLDQYQEDVRVLVSNEALGAGTYTTAWDGKDSRGIPALSGLYYIELRGYVPQTTIIRITAAKR